MAGDKIGIITGTPGGDSDTWGNTLVANVTLYDEFFYASREDRNLVVLGGGKISWDGSDLTFNANIEIRNHITSYKNVISSAASPCAINASHKVAYASLKRKPAADNTISALTVVAAGSLPNTTDDSSMGIFVLAYRTSEGTLIFPQLKRELLSGDHFNIGQSLSWFERIASSHKPSFKTNTSDNTQIKVPGSSTSPACVFIDGKLYVNTSDATLDVNTSGRNGLDTGTVASNTPYYLYAIPATSGRTFDLVCSTADPSTGPTGFSSWSYIGAFCTFSGSATLPYFQSSDGITQFHLESESESLTSATRTSKTFQTMPTLVKRALFQMSITSGASDKTGIISSTDSATDAAAITRQSNSVDNKAWAWVPIFTAQTIWMTSDTSSTFVVELYGWQENPKEYK